MKISELIEYLQQVLQKEGDLNVRISRNEEDSDIIESACGIYLGELYLSSY